MPLTDLPRTPAKTLIFKLSDADYVTQPDELFSTKEVQLDLDLFVGVKALYFRINRNLAGTTPPDDIKIKMGLINIMEFGGYMATSDVMNLSGKSNSIVPNYFYWVGGFAADSGVLPPRTPYDGRWGNSTKTPAGDIHMNQFTDNLSMLVPMTTFGSLDINTKLLISMQSEVPGQVTPFTIGDHTLELNGVF